MSIFRDRQIKGFFLFIVLYIILMFGIGAWFCQTQIAASKSMYAYQRFQTFQANDSDDYTQ